MPARTGAQFLRGLRDGRQVWLGARPHRRSDRASRRCAAPPRRSPKCSTCITSTPDDCLMPDPETGEPINVSHMIPRSREDLLRRHKPALERRRVLRRADGAHAGLHERHLCRVCRPAATSGRSTATRKARTNLVRVPEGAGARRPSLTHTIVHSTVDKAPRPRAGGLRRRRSCTRWRRPRTASWCAARACWRRWRRSPTRSRSIPASRCPMPTGATRCPSASRWTRRG